MLAHRSVLYYNVYNVLLMLSTVVIVIVVVIVKL